MENSEESSVEVKSSGACENICVLLVLHNLFALKKEYWHTLVLDWGFVCAERNLYSEYCTLFVGLGQETSEGMKKRRVKYPPFR